MKNILITGCAGFIGFHMCKILLEKKYKVVGIDNLNFYYPKNYSEIKGFLVAGMLLNRIISLIDVMILEKQDKT